MPNTETEKLKLKKSSNASAEAFGWIFQTAAGLFLMLDNIEDLKRLDMEGTKEDVEITLEDGSVIYAQAKSVLNPNDTKNVKAKLKKALGTLSTCNEPINKLVYISNIPNPLLSVHPKHYEYATTHFDDFFDEDKQYIIDNVKAGFPTAKFEIVNFKFFGKTANEKFSTIIKKIESFLGKTKVKPALAGRVLSEWRTLLFDNSAEVGHMTKSEIVFPLILVLIDNYDSAETYEQVCKHDLYDETMQKFASDIRDIPRSTEFYLSVIGDYQKTRIAKSKTITGFVMSNWENYKENFLALESNPQMLESLIKIILLATLSRRTVIESVREAVKLCL